MEESEQHLLHRVAFHASPVPIVLIDEAGEILGVNPAAARLFGITQDSSRGTHIGRLLPQFPGTCSYGLNVRGSFPCRVEDQPVRVSGRVMRCLTLQVADDSAVADAAGRHLDDGQIDPAPRLKLRLMQALGKAALDGLARTAMTSAASQSCGEAINAMVSLFALHVRGAPAATEPVELEQIVLQAIEQATKVGGGEVLYRIDSSAPVFCVSDAQALQEALSATLQHAFRRAPGCHLTIELRGSQVHAVASPVASIPLLISCEIRDASAVANPETIASWLRLPTLEQLPSQGGTIELLAARQRLRELGGGLTITSEPNRGLCYELRFAAAFAPGQDPRWRGLQPGLVGVPVIIAGTDASSSALLRDQVRQWGGKPSVGRSVAQVNKLAAAHPSAFVITTFADADLEILLAGLGEGRRVVMLHGRASPASKAIEAKAASHGLFISRVGVPYSPAQLLKQLTAVTPPARSRRSGDWTTASTRVRRKVAPVQTKPRLCVLAVLPDTLRRSVVIEELTRLGQTATVVEEVSSAAHEFHASWFDVILLDNVGAAAGVKALASLPIKPNQIVIAIGTGILPAASLGIDEYWAFPPTTAWAERLLELERSQHFLAQGSSQDLRGSELKAIEAQTVPAPRSRPPRPERHSQAPTRRGGLAKREVALTQRLRQLAPDGQVAKTAARIRGEFCAIEAQLRDASLARRPRVAAQLVAMSDGMGVSGIASLAKSFIAMAPDDERAQQLALDALLVEIRSFCASLERQISSPM